MTEETREDTEQTSAQAFNCQADALPIELQPHRRSGKRTEACRPQSSKSRLLQQPSAQPARSRRCPRWATSPQRRSRSFTMPRPARSCPKLSRRVRGGLIYPARGQAPAAAPQSFLYLRPRYGAVCSTNSSRGH